LSKSESNSQFFTQVNVKVLSKNFTRVKVKKVTTEKVTQVTGVKKPSSLTANTFHHCLPIIQYNAVNRLLRTEITKLILAELNDATHGGLRHEGRRQYAPNNGRDGAGLHTIHHDIKSRE